MKPSVEGRPTKVGWIRLKQVSIAKLERKLSTKKAGSGKMALKPEKIEVSKYDNCFLEIQGPTIVVKKTAVGKVKFIIEAKEVAKFYSEPTKDDPNLNMFCFSVEMNNNILYSLIADTENDRQEWIAFFEYEEHQKLIENFRIDIMSDQKVLTAIEKKCPAFPKNILASQVLEEIDFSMNNICSLPDDISRLSQCLVSLTLSNNDLTILPESFVNLKNLQVLTIASNRLQSLPDSFGNLVSLQSLTLSKNNLKTIPTSIGQCTNLSKLDVSSNPDLVIPHDLKNCVNLKWIDFSDIRLTSFPTALILLFSIQVLYLQNNMIPCLPSNCTYNVLREFNISHNLLEALPECFATSKTIEELNVSYNRLKTLPLAMSKSRSYLQAHENPFVDIPVDVVESGSTAIKKFLAKKT